MNETSNQDKIMSYKSLVAARAQQTSCLRNLLAFLQNDPVSQHPCRFICLDFSSVYDPSSYRNLDLDDLKFILSTISNGKGDIYNRLLIIEDLSNDVVETLDSSLDINPLFFASHIDIFQDDIVTIRPSTATLISIIRSQNFLTLPYHRVIKFKNHKTN